MAFSMLSDPTAEARRLELDLKVKDALDQYAGAREKFETAKKYQLSCAEYLADVSLEYAKFLRDHGL